MNHRTKRISLTILLSVWMSLSGVAQVYANEAVTEAPSATLALQNEEAPGEEAGQEQDQPAALEEEASEPEPLEEKISESEPLEEPAKIESAEEETTEIFIAEEPADTEPADTEPADTEPVETESTESEPTETEPTETEPAESEPAESESAEPAAVKRLLTAAAPLDNVSEEAKNSEEEEETASVPNITAEGHNLAFASDLHELPDVLENAMAGFPENTEYVSIIGDLVGERGGDAPEYNAEDVYDKVHGIINGVKPDQVSIIWADHDANVNNWENIVKCQDGEESGQIYEGKNADGSTAYYIYGVGFYHMLNGGEFSQAAANAFKEWVSGKDETIPVLVLCHAPILAKRGDNNGASYWNEALNYAATETNGISTDEDQAEIVRNVIFLSGHNHTVDKTEYVFPAGTSMLVQIDASEEPHLFSGAYFEEQEETVVYSEVVDEEYAEMVTGSGNHHRPKAQGVISNIFYTAMTPGYLKTSGNASLVSITDELIRIAKYNGGQPVSLGTNGATNAIMDAAMEILRIRWDEPKYTWSEDLSSVTATRSGINTTALNRLETAASVSSVTKAATCEEDGVRTYTAVFGSYLFETQTMTQVIPAIGHSWGDWTVVKEATATENGEMMRTCLNDPSHVETKIIPATGEEKQEQKASDDTADDKSGDSAENSSDNGAEKSSGEDAGDSSGDGSGETTSGTAASVSKSADTGDEANCALWIGLILAAAIGLKMTTNNLRGRLK